MKIKFSNLYIYIFLFMIIVVSIADIYLQKDHPKRYLAIYAQGIILFIAMVYLFKSTFKKYNKPKFLFFFMWAFVVMLAVYAVQSQNLDKLPVFLYGIVPFFIIFHAAYSNHIHEQTLYIFAVLLLILYAYETYFSIYDRMSLLKDFFSSADNVGYKLLFLMLLFSINLKKPINILFLTLSFFLVLLSFKRGAMIIGAVAYCIAIYYVFKNSKEFSFKIRRRIFWTSLSLLLVVISSITTYWDILMYRFVSDVDGSGRAVFYPLIFEGWSKGGFVNKFFGFGFFEVPKYLKGVMGWEIYAHSDWLELIYDHGVLGVGIYFLLMISVLSYNKIVKIYRPDMYHLFLIILSLWFLKSIFSGVYINKDSIILFMVLGFLFGSIYKNLDINEKS